MWIVCLVWYLHSVYSLELLRAPQGVPKLWPNPASPGTSPKEKLNSLQSKIQSFMIHTWIMVSSWCVYYPLSVSWLYFCVLFWNILSDICRWASWKYDVLVREKQFTGMHWFSQIFQLEKIWIKEEGKERRKKEKYVLYSKLNIWKHCFWCRA